MAKESKYSWNDMFKLDNLTPAEQETTKVESEVEQTSETTETEETETDPSAGVAWKEGEEETEVESETKVGETSKDPKTPEVKTQTSPEGVFAPFMGLIKEGVLIFDESKEYDNSIDGVKDLLQENINKGVDAWKNQYPPEALEVLEHIKNGGSLRELIQVEQDGPNYESDVDLTDETHQKYLIEDWLAEQGFEQDEIKTKLEKYEEAGILEDEAKTAHSKLIKLQKKKREQLIENQKQETERRKQEFQTKTEGFKKKVLETKEIAGFQLKSGEEKTLLDYMTRPVKEGKTQLQLDYDEETQLKMAYFMMKKFNFKDVEKKAETKATIKLKEAVSRATDPNLKTKGTTVPKDEEETRYSNDVPNLPWIKTKK